MSIRERILTVYRGETPDVVPYMLDLSHWFYHKHGRPWDLSQSYEEPERELIAYHKRVGAGFYVPNLAALYAVDYGDDVRAEVVKAPSPDEAGLPPSRTIVGAGLRPRPRAGRETGPYRGRRGRSPRRRGARDGAPEITWRLITPRGAIERKRVWEERSHSWPISAWGVETQHDLRVLADALAGRTYSPRWHRYRAWADAVGEDGVVYMLAGYSAMGQLLHYWMGVERVMYAIHDWPDTMREVVDRVNENNLGLIDLLATSPAEIIIMGDNFSSDVQPPHFFAQWSRPYYAEAMRRLHAAGKAVAVHIDGRLRGALRMIGETGADCADAVTPTPMGDLSPLECRSEAGPQMILSGGVSPDLWLPTADAGAFASAVQAWLELKRYSPRLIANAGDQVPPGAQEQRIEIMRDLVERYGRY